MPPAERSKHKKHHNDPYPLDKSTIRLCKRAPGCRCYNCQKRAENHTAENKEEDDLSMPDKSQKGESSQVKPRDTEELQEATKEVGEVEIGEGEKGSEGSKGSMRFAEGKRGILKRSGESEGSHTIEKEEKRVGFEYGVGRGRSDGRKGQGRYVGAPRRN
ncbi:hypothetical protein GLAREA_04313 [Glarea lozoyensis ATCC 20868]|uniref:Uncharacterized protein n=1 Tax=Glarea lozoyensis (strain ATCC 20868 / MF5171) TaxID=1116229 RepID=S3CLY8_GLAL2|nr:uncharacterized protein GLAREA_04313 [Glarea lozoyensis ATCC 20868]EPE27522.1 hypothetical protein GLAREA_04313 [Glarea lozoyensis ATCC 20868]